MLTTIQSILLYTAPFLAVLAIVVFVHEMGHFLVGRWCGVRVDAFSLGFGPELFHFYDRHGTRWRIGAIPLGGYVKFHGDANAAGVGEDKSTEAMSEAERATTFAAQPIRNRAAIVAAGPIANFILAVAMFAGLFFFMGRATLAPRVDNVSANSPAQAAGFMPNDVVTRIDGTAIDHFGAMQRIIASSGDKTLTFEVKRGDQTVVLQATPKVIEVETRLGVVRTGQLGLEGGSRPEDWRMQTFGAGDSLRMGVEETWFIVKVTFTYVGKLLVGRESPNQLSGPAGLAHVSGEMAKMGLGSVLNLVAILSVSIGLLNLFPIPLLDGGHLVFYAIEALRGRALNERAQEICFKIGMACVGTLMIVATYNDIMRIGPQLLKWILRS